MIRRLQVTGEFLVEFLKNESTVSVRVSNGLPSDAKLVGLEGDLPLGQINLLIASEAYLPGDPDIIEPPRVHIVQH